MLNDTDKLPYIEVCCSSSRFHRRYMAEILPIRRKTLYNQSINPGFQSTYMYTEMPPDAEEGLHFWSLVVLQSRFNGLHVELNMLW